MSANGRLAEGMLAGAVPATPWALAAGDEGDIGPVATEVGDGWADGVNGNGAVGV